jgi:hypothetical protein
MISVHCHDWMSAIHIMARGQVTMPCELVYAASIVFGHFVQMLVALVAQSAVAAHSWSDIIGACAQVYAASIMFGYFVRRVDRRFQLERSLGMLPQNQEEAVARLERLFSQARAALPALGSLHDNPCCWACFAFKALLFKGFIS